MLRFVIAAIALVLWLGAPPVLADSDAAGAGDFRVIVENSAGRDGLGVFGAITSETHPRGADQDILATRDGDDAFSSFVTVRSYTTGTDYVQTSRGPGSSNRVVSLEPYASVLPIDDGWRAFCVVPTTAPGGEALTVSVDVTAEGNEIRVAAQVTNSNEFAIDVGLRFLLDVSLDGDSGPAVANGSSVSGDEASLGTSPVTLRSMSGAELTIGADGQTPDDVQLAHWNRAFDSAFSFEPSGVDVASGVLDDSAVLVFFGDTPASQLHLDPGESASVAVVLGEPGSQETPSPSPTVSLEPTLATSTPSITTSSSTASAASSLATTVGPGGLPNTGGGGIDVGSPVGVLLVALAVLAGSGAIVAAATFARHR